MSRLAVAASFASFESLLSVAHATMVVAATISIKNLNFMLGYSIFVSLHQ